MVVELKCLERGVGALGEASEGGRPLGKSSKPRWRSAKDGSNPSSTTSSSSQYSPFSTTSDSSLYIATRLTLILRRSMPAPQTAKCLRRVCIPGIV